MDYTLPILFSHLICLGHRLASFNVSYFPCAGAIDNPLFFCTAQTGCECPEAFQGKTRGPCRAPSMRISSIGLISVQGK